MPDETLIRPLHQEDLDALYRIRQIAFLDNVSLSNPDVQQAHLETLRYKYGRFVDGRLVSSASWYPFTMHVGGEPRTVGGLASVVSAAATRRQGHVRALMAHGLEMLRDDGIGWCLEYPFDTRYYRRFGWETVANGFVFEVPVERFARFDARVDVTRLEPDAATSEHLGQIYSRWASAYTFTMARDGQVRDDWATVVSGAPWEESKPRFVFAMDDAYLINELDRIDGGKRLTVYDYAFASPEGRVGMFSFLNHFAGQVDAVRLQLPGDDPLVLEWSNFMVAHPHPLHARIVDAAQALSGWPADERFGFTVEVVDDFCAWNDAVFRVEVEDAHTVAQPVDEPAQLCLDVRTLAQILSGSLTASAALCTGLVRGQPEAVERLCGLNKRPCYMSLADYF